MRLTALCICGTLLALVSLPWTAADFGEGDLLGDKGFGPCAASLRPEGACGPGQDENTCSYLFSLPPLTVHLPKQLRELEKIVKDLQKLKDNVDQLRQMCADCTVSQSERECGSKRERECEKLNEGTDRHGDEKNWMNEREPGRLKGCRTDRVKVEKTKEWDGDTDTENIIALEEKERENWEAERQSEKGAIKENEKEDPLKEAAEKDGKSQTEWAKGNDNLGQAKVPKADGEEKIVHMARENVFQNNNRDTNKDRNKKGFSKGERESKLDSGQDRKITINMKDKEKIRESGHDVRQGETKETEKKTQNEEDRGSDGIKMSEEHEEHTNKEQEQHGEVRKKETEKGIKADQHNGKPKQTENTEKKKTVKVGETGEVDRETGKEINTKGEKTVQSVQRDSDGGSASRKATERTSFVSIGPTPQSTFGLDEMYDSMDSSEGTALTSPRPPPPLSSLITDVNQEMITAYELPTQSTGAAGIFEHPNRPTTIDTINTLGGPGPKINSPTFGLISTTSVKPGAGLRGWVSSATTTTSPAHDLYTTTFPGVTDHSRWTTKRKISSNSKTRVKPLPSQGPRPDKKHKPGIKPEVDQRPKNPKGFRKPDQAPFTDKKTKHDQKQKPSHQKSTTGQKYKPGKDAEHVQISKPDQRPLTDNLTIDQNLKNNLKPKHEHRHTAIEKKLPHQKLPQKPIPPVQRPTSHIPVDVNISVSDKDPLTDQQPENHDISIINQNSKPDKKLHHPAKTNKPDRKQTPGTKMTSEEKSKHGQRSEPNKNFTHVQGSESETGETSRLAPKPKPATKLMGRHDEDSLPGQRLTPHRAVVPSGPKPKSSEKIPKNNQTAKPGHLPKINQKPAVLVRKPNVKPKPGQALQTNQGTETPLTDQMSNLNPKSVPDEIPEAESNRRAKPVPPPRHRPPARPVLKPGSTPVRRPKPAVVPKPRPKTKAELELARIGVTTSNSTPHAHTDLPPTSGTVKQTDVTHSQGITEFSPSSKKTITQGPKPYISPETTSLPHLHSLPESFTMSPNSRITSDLRPQAVGQPSSVPVTARPNNINRESLPSVISTSSASPTSTKKNPSYNTDSSLQTTTLDNVEETAPRPTPNPDKMMIPVPAQSTSTVSPDLRPTSSANSGPKLPDGESFTPSARELRVKINQVAAVLNNSLGLNGRPLDRSNEHPKDNQGGSGPDRADSKLPLTSSKESTSMRDCSDHRLRGETKSGVYLVTPDIRSKSFPAVCDMQLGGGGWTLIQRRQDGSVSFNRTWAEYRSGFGELDGGEFWLGNDMIHLLTRDRDMVLRVELEDFDGVMKYAQYEQFRVASERQRYRLTVGGYSGRAGDALRFSKTYDHNNRAFTTPDKDHDRYPSGNCGAYYSSGWWFDACMAANLNGRYYVEKYKGIRDGIFWGTWQNTSTEYYPTSYRQSFKSVRMMIRPKGFAP